MVGMHLTFSMRSTRSKWRRQHCLHRRLRDERGASVVTALMIALIVFAMGGLWTNVGVHQVSLSSHDRMREQALHAAEAGINEAISTLAGDLQYAGTSGVVTLPDGGGEFEVTVVPVDPTDPYDPDRYITAMGYAPSKAASRRAVRRLEQQVLLDPLDGFEFALFAAPGGIVGNNYARVTGDVYSRDNVTVEQNSVVSGDLVTRGTVATGNKVLVTGNVHALGSVTLENSQTEIQGSVFSGGDVSGSASVGTDVQAAGSVSLSGTVGGKVSAPSTPPEPPELGQPTFTWDASNYTPVGSPWTETEDFVAHWSVNKDAMEGAHRITDTDPMLLDSKWTMTKDVTIVSDGPITLSRDVSAATSAELVLTIVSYADVDPAINLTNNVTLPSNIKLVLFAPNGSIAFGQNKSFHGVAYGEQVHLAQNMTLTHSQVSAPGFDWDTSSARRFIVKLRTFREVAVP